jgi:two-component system, NtrC family, sensor kinase
MSDVPASFSKTKEKDYPYFRGVWNRVVVALTAASFIPLILIGGGMYYYATSALKEKTLTTLRMQVINRKDAVDQFLAERTMDLKVVSANMGLDSLITPGVLEGVFLSLRSAEGRPCFTDLGIINDQGRHLAYVGPYNLISKDYKDAPWFKAVMGSGVYISDVFLGFRRVPHFIIAVKQADNKGAWIIRATVDTVYFDSIVSQSPGKRKGDAFLVNRNGVFQTNPRMGGQLMGQSEFTGLEPFEGVKLEERQGQIHATAWLENVPWLCVVNIDQDEIFDALHRVRNTGIFVFILGAILIILTVLLITNQLVSILETKRRNIRFLDKQLRHTSYMASSMELSHGFFREINDTLANIDVAATWIQDLSREGSSDEIEKSLDQIKSEVSRSRKSIDKFLRFIRPGHPVITEININEILDDLLGFLSGELRFKNIKATRDYQDHLPNIRSDRPKLRKVFQAIVLNAVSAIGEDGEISLTTRADENGVTVIVADNGPGIPEENIEKIFDPLFTTKPEGSGLGLAICLNILQRLGGSISVRSEAGKGASFIIELPFQFKLLDNNQ